MATTSRDSGARALFLPLTVWQFRDQYWPDRVYHAHHDAASLLDGIGLSNVSTLDAVLARWQRPVRVHFQDPKGLNRQTTVSAVEAHHEYAAGASLSFERFETIDDTVRHAVRSIARELGVPESLASCVAFAAPPGSGVPMHFDAKEVIAVQIAGRKRWTLAPNVDVAYPLSDCALANPPASTSELHRYGSALIGRRTLDDVWTVDTQPGSVLFVPRGYWHATTALGPSWSISLVFAAPTFLDALLATVRQALIVDPAWRSPMSSHDAHVRWRSGMEQTLNNAVDAFVRGATVDVSDHRPRQ